MQRVVSAADFFVLMQGIGKDMHHGHPEVRKKFKQLRRKAESLAEGICGLDESSRYLIDISFDDGTPSFLERLEAHLKVFSNRKPPLLQATRGAPRKDARRQVVDSLYDVFHDATGREPGRIVHSDRPQKREEGDFRDFVVAVVKPIDPDWQGDGIDSVIKEVIAARKKNSP